MIDYQALDGAVGHNWYDLDPMLVDRVKAENVNVPVGALIPAAR